MEADPATESSGGSIAEEVPVAARDLELVLAVPFSDGPTWPRLLSEVFKELVTALSAAEIRYMFTGMIAYGLYAPARYTSSIDLIVYNTSPTKLTALFGGIEFCIREELKHLISFESACSAMTISVRFHDAYPEPCEIESPLRHTVYGLDIPVIKRESLIWMFCRDNNPEMADLTVGLINAGDVDLSALRRDIEAAKDGSALVRLNLAISAASRTKSSSYSTSRHARLAGRRVGTRPLPG
jgi:hypothetical protein